MEVPVRFGTLTKLAECSFRNNRLENFEFPIRSMNSLQVLDLRANRLRFVPKTLEDTNSQKKLDLRWNPIDMETLMDLESKSSMLIYY
jgi:Leucine-rich repeat (LRR) protein